MPRKFKPKEVPDLNPKQRIFVEQVMKHGNKKKAAEAAGYSPLSSTGTNVAKSKAVQAALSEVREKSIVAAAYNADMAMKEADDAIQFARDTENANAYVKAVELKAKLQGLLIEKHHHLGLAPLQINIGGIDDPPVIDVKSIPVEEDPFS